MDNIKEITKKIEGKAWEDAKAKALEKVSKKIKIDGFRQGHAPKDIVIKKYGEDALNLDAADICLEEAYMEMIEENKDF